MNKVNSLMVLGISVSLLWIMVMLITYTMNKMSLTIVEIESMVEHCEDQVDDDAPPCVWSEDVWQN